MITVDHASHEPINFSIDKCSATLNVPYFHLDQTKADYFEQLSKGWKHPQNRTLKKRCENFCNFLFEFVIPAYTDEPVKIKQSKLYTHLIQLNGLNIQFGAIQAQKPHNSKNNNSMTEEKLIELYGSVENFTKSKELKKPKISSIEESEQLEEKYTRGVRLEWNPNKVDITEFADLIEWFYFISTQAQHQSKEHFETFWKWTRLDFATDYPFTINTNHIRSSLQEERIIMRNKKIGTHYYGSSGGRRAGRIYNKKQEMLDQIIEFEKKEKHKEAEELRKEVVKLDELWRWEMSVACTRFYENGFYLFDFEKLEHWKHNPYWDFEIGAFLQEELPSWESVWKKFYEKEAPDFKNNPPPKQRYTRSAYWPKLPDVSTMAQACYALSHFTMMPINHVIDKMNIEKSKKARIRKELGLRKVRATAQNHANDVKAMFGISQLIHPKDIFSGCITEEYRIITKPIFEIMMNAKKEIKGTSFVDLMYQRQKERD